MNLVCARKCVLWGFAVVVFMSYHSKNNETKQSVSSHVKTQAYGALFVGSMHGLCFLLEQAPFSLCHKKLQTLLTPTAEFKICCSRQCRILEIGVLLLLILCNLFNNHPTHDWANLQYCSLEAKAPKARDALNSREGFASTWSRGYGSDPFVTSCYSLPCIVSGFGKLYCCFQYAGSSLLLAHFSYNFAHFTKTLCHCCLNSAAVSIQNCQSEIDVFLWTGLAALMNSGILGLRGTFGFPKVKAGQRGVPWDDCIILG